jgi:hypothetical protein
MSAANNTNDDEGILDLENQGLTELPTSHPNYATTRLLFLQENNLTVLDASQLPPNLELLNVENNQIREIRGKFPRSLTVLWLTNNKLTTLPKFPSHITDLQTNGNPILTTTTNNSSANPTRQIQWYSQEKFRDAYTDDEALQFNLDFSNTENFQAKLDVLKTKIDIESLCRAKIKDEYFVVTLDITDEFLIEQQNKDILAFALLKREKSLLHIHLICSSPQNPGGGSRLLNKILLYFGGHPEIKKITLDSIPATVSFYESKEFRRCIEGQMCPMEYVRPTQQRTRSASFGGSKRRRKTHRRLRLSRRVQTAE